LSIDFATHLFVHAAIDDSDYLSCSRAAQRFSTTC